MKKRLSILLIVLLAVIVAVTAVACETKDVNGLVILKTPKISLEGNTVTWNAVKNASEYGVKIGENEDIVVKSTSYTIDPALGTANVSVRAIGDQKKYGYSEYSSPVAYVAKNMLAAPTLSYVKEADGSINLSWNAVANASGYTLRFSSESKGNSQRVSYDTTNTSYTIGSENFTTPDIYYFEVKANGSESYRDSAYSQPQNYVVETQLSAPEASYNPATGAITWSSVENTKKYYLKLIDVATGDEIQVRDYQSTSTNLTNFTIDNAGTYKLQIKSSGEYSAVYKDSDWKDVVLSTDTTKTAEIIKNAAPQNVVIETRDIEGLNKIVVAWDYMDGVSVYNVRMSSGTGSSFSFEVKDVTSQEKCYYVLDDNTNMSSDTNGGKVFTISVGTPRNEEMVYTEGFYNDALTKYHFTSEPKEIDGVYQITNLAELMHLKYMDTANKKFVLTKNINCDSADIYPITKEFKGIFDGGNKIISDFKLITTDGQTPSLFGNVATGAEIYDLAVVDATVKSDEDAAILANKNAGKISRITLTGSVTSAKTAAGLVNDNTGVVENVQLRVEITGVDYAGGVASKNSGTIFNAGINYGSKITVTNDPKNGTQTAYAGGIAGYSTGSISYSYIRGGTVQSEASGDVMGAAVSGGIVGMLNGGSVEACYADKRVKIGAGKSGENNTATAGALVGAAISSGKNSVVRDSYVYSADISASNNIGGIIGRANGVEVTNVYLVLGSDSNMSNTGHRGAIVGLAEGNNTYSNVYYYISNGNAIVGASDDTANKITRIQNPAEMKTVDLGDVFSTNSKIYGGAYQSIHNLVYLDNHQAFSGINITQGTKDRNPSEVYYGGSDTAIKTTEMGEGNVVYIKGNYSSAGFAIETFQYKDASGKVYSATQVLTVKFR